MGKWDEELRTANCRLRILTGRRLEVRGSPRRIRPRGRGADRRAAVLNTATTQLRTLREEQSNSYGNSVRLFLLRLPPYAEARPCRFREARSRLGCARSRRLRGEGE